MPPMAPVMANCGNRLATATPAWALAKCSCSSAARTSGRCSTIFEGKLSGSSCGKCKVANSNFSSTSSLGRFPASTRIKSRVCSSCFCKGREIARPAPEKLPEPPPPNRIRSPDQIVCAECPDSLLRATILAVAASCARMDASCNAAATTLDARVM